MKIGVYATARNESQNVEPWFRSTVGADVVVVNDSGSTDDTVQRFRDLGVDVRQEPVEPPIACVLFNTALNLLPEDVDLAIRLDLDERLQPGWREALDKITIVGPTVVQPWFDHMGVTYRHDRIHSRHGFCWDLPVHEVLVCDGPYTRVPVELTIEHHQDMTKDRSTVLGELQAAYDADPTNLRLLHYLGREWTYRARWDMAIPLLRQHAMSDAFPEERSESWRLLGDCYAALMPPEEQSQIPYSRAVGACPGRREGHVALADLFHRQGRWELCRVNALAALAITEKSWYFNQPAPWNGQPEHLVALASWHLDRFDQALEYGRRAVELEPDNEIYVSNLRFYESAVVGV